MVGRVVLARVLHGTPRVLTDKDFEDIINAAITGRYGVMRKVENA